MAQIHVLPLSRGSANTFKNVVGFDRRVNHRKANRSPEEAGLRLRAKPVTPRPVPATLLIRNLHDVAEWLPFVADRSGQERGARENPTVFTGDSSHRLAS